MFATLTAFELTPEPEIVAPTSTEAEPVAESPVRSRWAWRRKDVPEAADQVAVDRVPPDVAARGGGAGR